MPRNEYPQCPGCGLPLKRYNAASSELCEGWEFACDGCLFRNHAGEIEVNWECRGTTPLEDAIAADGQTERERCAKIAESFADHADGGEVYIARRIADAIRNPNSEASALLD